LDSYVLKEVEAYRIRNNLSLNKSIKQNKWTENYFIFYTKLIFI
jgi:hypothetical protein